MSGFIAIHRDSFDHPLLKDGDRFRAWFWMVARACWRPTRFDIGGKVVTLQRGQFCVSVRDLADAWGWSKSAVDRFLTRLKTETMIGTETGTGRLIITICNYDKYQHAVDHGGTDAGTQSGTAAGQQRDTKETLNTSTKEEVANATPSKSRRRKAPEPPVDLPNWLPVEPWQAFLDMRDRKGATPTAHAIELLIGKLDRFRAKGHDPTAVLNQSTINNWTDVYPIKDQANGSRSHTNRSPSPSNPRDNRDGFERAIDRRLDERGTDQPAGPARRPDPGHGGGAGEITIASVAGLR